MNKVILSAVVGSRAHGLHRSDSDWDVRSVYVQPTKSFFTLGKKGLDTSEQQEVAGIIPGADFVSFEVGRFLELATKSNSSILEIFLGPILKETTDEGDELVSLFSHVWSSRGVVNAFVGYGRSQQKRLGMFEVLPLRERKHGVAWLRTVYNATQLLTTKTMAMDVNGTEIEPIVRRWANLDIPVGPAEVNDTCLAYEAKLIELEKNMEPKHTNFAPLNDYIVRIRRKYF